MTQHRILIADADPTTLAALEHALTSIDCVIFRATSIFDAIHLAVDHRVDVAIVDFGLLQSLGRTPGLTFYARTLALFFVLTTQRIDDLDHHVGEGALGCLPKPIDPIMSRLVIQYALAQIGDGATDIAAGIITARERTTPENARIKLAHRATDQGRMVEEFCRQFIKDFESGLP